jgi:hypothetical protein
MGLEVDGVVLTFLELPALASEFATVLQRTVRAGLPVAAVFVIGRTHRLGPLAIKGFAEPALRLVPLLGLRFGHTGSLARTARPGLWF